jgi:glutamate 5-kinase
LSRGGMTTKIEAGKIATKAGTAMIIAKGTEDHPLQALRQGAPHTLFLSAETRAQARKRWIMGSLDVAGTLGIDDGAARALMAGKSLLPIGVTRVTGEFSRGDAVSIVTPDGREIARGLTGFDSEEAQLVKGKRSQSVIDILGVGNRAEMVHRDNLVLTAERETEEIQ